MVIKFQLCKIILRDLLYKVVNNTVLCTLKFVKRVDLMLCSYHNKKKKFKLAQGLKFFSN